MSATYTIDGVEIQTVRAGEVELTQTAEHGDVGQGRIRIDDAAGTLAIVGQKDVAVDEDDCSDPIAFRGFVANRDIGREAEVVGASREIDVSVEDLNAMLSFRGIDGSDRKRPQETVAARGAWLLASDYVSGLFVDNGRCDFSTKLMDKADYTDQYPGDVLTDMALAQLEDVNHYIRDFGDGPEIVFRNDMTSTADTSSIHISNRLSDVDLDTVFPPSRDFKLTRSPANVKSKLSYQHARGRVVVERSTTADAYNGERFGTASNSNVKTALQAQRQAKAQLRQLKDEEDTLEGSILVPSTHANLLNHGDRVGVRFTDMTPEGYFDADEWVYCRVLELTRKPIVSDPPMYELDVRLRPQREAEAGCPYEHTESQTFYPLGGTYIADENRIAAISKKNIYYIRPGYRYPTRPEEDGSLRGGWHFQALGAGGTGTIDYAGDCVQNTLRFIVVGNGTLTIQSEIFGGSPRNFNVSKFGWLNNNVTRYEFIGRFTAGDVIEVVVDDATTDDECVTIIDVAGFGGAGPGESCGGKAGWSSAEWVSDE